MLPQTVRILKETSKIWKCKLPLPPPTSKCNTKKKSEKNLVQFSILIVWTARPYLMAIIWTFIFLITVYKICELNNEMPLNFMIICIRIYKYLILELRSPWRYTIYSYGERFHVRILKISEIIFNIILICQEKKSLKENIFIEFPVNYFPTYRKFAS